jgi:RNA polymerase sigma factor (TIGR02999 family)
MRQILVDHARAKAREKRGGGRQRLTLDGAQLAASAPQLDLVDLDDALRRLEGVDESYARIVELRFFAGLPEHEAAEAIGISRPTASRAWRFARAWLIRDLWPNANS